MRVGRRRVRRARHRVRRLAAGRDAGPRQVLRWCCRRRRRTDPRRRRAFRPPTRCTSNTECVPRLPMPDWNWTRPSGLMMNRPSKPIEPPAYGLTATPMPRALVPCVVLPRSAAFFSSHLNSSRPLSSASLTNALVTYACFAVRQRGAERRLAGRRVDLADLDLIDAELARRLDEDRLHDADALHAAGRALRGFRRRVGQHRQPAPAHRFRLVGQRHRRARRAPVALRVVRAVVADRVHVDRGDPAVLAEADLRRARGCPDARGR